MSPQMGVSDSTVALWMKISLMIRPPTPVEIDSSSILLNPTKLRITALILLDVRPKGNNANYTDRKMIQVPEEDSRSKQSVVVALIDYVVWIVLA